ncbi:MAG: Glu/Leu/Phe/Val dehydrogenase [Anaerolineales bacterium]|nr:Glu/Leu/Phe/Val dehydrogenase [Anaerolineales bacterium]
MSKVNPQTYSLFKIAQEQFDRIADVLELSPATRDLLRMPIREYHFSIPVRMDDGETKIFRGFRIQHNDARGPGKGGIRFHPLGTVETVRALAMWNTWRCAVADLPLGGSMGGVVCDPHDLSLLEQERICRGWVRQVSRNVGPEWDVPSPDLMTTAQHMLWMLDEFETIHSSKSPGFITGKPVGMGGSSGRKEATGYGLMVAVREALKEMEIKPSDTLASFQGFGNVAQHAIQLYQRMGGVVVCVSSWNQADLTAYAFYKQDGINLDELLPISNPFGEINKAKAIEMGYECLPGESWIEQDVDILVPAALENQITLENVGKVSRRVKIIAEGADGPTNPEVDPLLTQRDVYVIPDILANAGGATCSYFEQVQSNMNYYWHRDEVLGKLDLQMTSAYIEISNFARSRKLPLRDAAYIVAVDRVVRACQERGWV